MDLIDVEEFWKWLKSQYCYDIAQLKHNFKDLDEVINEINSINIEKIRLEHKINNILNSEKGKIIKKYIKRS